MQKTINLINSILVDGTETKQLPFDTDVFTSEMFERANKLNQQKGAMTVMEFDTNLHLTIAKLIIEGASGGAINYEDMARLKGADLFTVARAGRDFLLESATPQADKSDEQSESTVECGETTPQNLENDR